MSSSAGEATVKIQIDGTEHQTNIRYDPSTQSTAEQPLNHTLEAMRQVYQRVNDLFTENLKNVKTPAVAPPQDDEDEEDEDATGDGDSGVTPSQPKKQKTSKTKKN